MRSILFLFSTSRPRRSSARAALLSESWVILLQPLLKMRPRNWGRFFMPAKLTDLCGRNSR